MIQFNHSRKQQGFSLIEILITSVIVSISVLGLVSLQLSELRNTRNALISSQASILLTDISERIRANPTQVASYDLAHAATLQAVNCKTKDCTPAQLAAYDLYTWQAMLKQSLPSGGGTVTPAGSSLTISIRWDQNLDGSTKLNCPPKSDQDLDCLQITISI
jgi:type IV pilus assembly protein PilV